MNDRLASAIIASCLGILVVAMAIATTPPTGGTERVVLASLGIVAILLGVWTWTSTAPYRYLVIEGETIRIGTDRVLFTNILKVWINRRNKTIVFFLDHPIRRGLPLCMFWIARRAMDDVGAELRARIPSGEVLETNHRGLFLMSPEIAEWLARPPAWGRR